MKPRDALLGIFFGATLVILAVTGCARRPAAEPSAAPYVQVAVASFGSIEPARNLAGVIAPVSKRRDSELALRARQRRIRPRRRYGSRRTAPRAARYVRSASAARRRQRDGEQQSRQHRPHQLSRLAQHFAGRRYAACRRSSGAPGPGDAAERYAQSCSATRIC